MTSIAPIYLPYLVLIDCCMATCTCTHANLNKLFGTEGGCEILRCFFT
jgi:hypothetical protein